MDRLKPRLIVIGPIPPPYHGVTVSTSLVLSNQILRDRFAVEHLDTSDHRSGGVGTWDIANIVLALRALMRLLARLRGRRGLVYLPLSQNAPGFLRDSLLVHVAKASGWSVAAHLRGGELHHFHAKQRRFVRSWIPRTLSRVDSLAIMGESLREVVSGLIPAERIVVVPNGTPTPRANGTGDDTPTVLYLSNLRRRKGVFEALEAAQIVLQQEKRVRFVFVGTWESEDVREELQRRAGGDCRIEFVPGVRDGEKDRFLATASVLLFPPLEPEGHPRVILEALAAGLPVVTTRRGAIAETVIDGESGYVLDDPIPALLADRLLILLRDEQLRERMGASARSRHLELYTQDIADRRLAEWLEGVAQLPLR